ncbi:hypothetical protein TESG_08617 [Trichophyton tonsurans CBS 112818]|uniref:Uncharacterized protein n=1 Tax=Trichophyton tonsurans (strain CBS 112818) TaxID=647933 RepID=F2S8H9_TRIT1|nr:hypothetical protein TESG_08617 [Trichophyton tonsurans CBS 112818]
MRGSSDRAAITESAGAWGEDSARLQLQVSGRRRAFARLKSQWFSEPLVDAAEIWRLVKHRGPVTGEREAQVWGMVWGTQQCQSATQPPSHPDVGHAPSEPSENRLEGSRRSFLERCTAAVATGWIMPALRLPVFPLCTVLQEYSVLTRLYLLKYAGDTSYPRIDSGFKATDQLQDGSMVP